MLVFDTSAIPVHQRRDAIADSLTHAASATSMSPEGPPETLHLTLDIWDLGGVELVDARCSANTLRRGRKPYSDEEALLAITCCIKGRGVHTQQRHQLAVRPDRLLMTDFSAPYVHQVSDTRTITAKIPLHLLGVPHDLAGTAQEHLGKSPLAGLFFRHVLEVRRVADDLRGPAALALGTATLALARALFASVADDEHLGRETLEDILLLRVKAFVRENLDDPTLDPSRIAAATHVSLRHLYKTCAKANLRLEQWIIGQRLAAAREDLARRDSGFVAVSEVSYKWGFTNPSHFARRFRGAYGMSPREWQAANREGAADRLM
jgi:AraC-like DNA-binding protein